MGAYLAPSISPFCTTYSDFCSVRSIWLPNLIATIMEVAGAIIGVISLGIQATQCLVKYYTTAKDQKTDTSRTISKQNSLVLILNSLDSNSRNRKFQPIELALLKTIQHSIEECEEYIYELSNESKILTEAPTPNRLTRTASSNIEAFACTAARRVTYPFHRK